MVSSSWRSTSGDWGTLMRWGRKAQAVRSGRAWNAGHGVRMVTEDQQGVPSLPCTCRQEGAVQQRLVARARDDDEVAAGARR